MAEEVRAKQHPVIATIPFGDGPWGIAIANSGDLWVANHGSVGARLISQGGAVPNSVALIDAESGQRRLIREVGARPTSIVMNANRSLIAVGGEYAPTTLMAIDASFDLRLPASTGGSGQAFSPDGKRLYAVSFREVLVIDTETGLEQKRSQLPAFLAGIAVSLDGSTLFVGASTGSEVFILDTESLTLLDVVALPESGVREILAASNGSDLYVSGGERFSSSGSLFVIDIPSRSLRKRIRLPTSNSWAMALTPNGSRLYVTLAQENGRVVVLDTAAGDVIGTIPVGSNPRGIAINALGTRAYVTNLSSNSISVLDLTKPLPNPPSSPARVFVKAKRGYAIVSWRESKSPGGAPVEVYEVTTNQGPQTCKSDTGQCTIRGLVPGKNYVFMVRARNAFGLSQARTTDAIKALAPPPRRPSPTPSPRPTPSPKPEQQLS